MVDLTGAAPAVAGTIPVGHKPHGIAFTPDGKQAFVANFADGTVTPIDTATDTAGHADRGRRQSRPDRDHAGRQHRLRDRQRRERRLSRSPCPPRTVGAPIIVGAGKEHPLGIAITPDGKKAYVANNGTESSAEGNGDTVTPITLATNTAGHADRHGFPGLGSAGSRRHAGFEDRLRDQLARHLPDRYGDRHARGPAPGAPRRRARDRHRARSRADRGLHRDERAARFGDRVRRLGLDGRRRHDRLLRLGLRRRRAPRPPRPRRPPTSTRTPGPTPRRSRRPTAPARRSTRSPTRARPRRAWATRSRGPAAPCTSRPDRPRRSR